MKGLWERALLGERGLRLLAKGQKEGLCGEGPSHAGGLSPAVARSIPLTLAPLSLTLPTSLCVPAPPPPNSAYIHPASRPPLDLLVSLCVARK